MRRIPSILVALLPYGYVVPIALALFFDMDTPGFSAYDPFGFLFLYMIFGILLSLIYAFGKHNGNLLIRACALPVDLSALGYFIYKCIEVRIAAANGAFEGELAIFLLGLLLAPYILMRIVTNCATAAACARSTDQKCYLHPLLHLVPIAGLFSAGIVHRKLHK